ncbi:hypothetical protein [Streptomyces sp. NRRL F-5135]|uniref:hypothetical protein n=1 Tax=Streptomyces sp. NRRL F-5135 TaxID=1463858 RepID=UPI0004C6E290|nr:hypothetical protein [Streptomyces sp. NRRL F-5135]
MGSDEPDAHPVDLNHPAMVFMRQIQDLSESLDRAEAAAAESGQPYESEVHEAARLLLYSAGKFTIRQVTEVTNRNAFHWVLTVTGTVAGRQTLLGARGVVRPESDDTRQSICDRLVDSLCADSERATGKPYLDAKVLFFDLQLNVLPDPDL